MSARGTAGAVALASATALLVMTVVFAVAGQGWTVGWTGSAMGPAMMSGGMMGGAMGPGMMGGGHMSGGHMSSLGDASRGVTAPITGAPTVSVTATEFKLSPAGIALRSREANVTLVNHGAILHDITVPGLGIHVAAAAGQTTTVGLRDLPAGRYAGYCSVPGHAEMGMRIAVTVE